MADNHDEKQEDAGYSDISAECEPSFMILARLAEMYLEGKNGVEKNAQEAADLFTEAAEKAMQSGKGRLANKYYALVENCLSEC